MRDEGFPSTHGTWMFDLLSGAENTEAVLRHQVMERYHAALVAYARKAIRLQAFEPEELVNAFLATRLDRPHFFLDWQASGLPFRRWLINGMHFCARELARERSGARATASSVSFGGGHRSGVAAAGAGAATLEPHAAPDASADRAFEREFSLQLIARAAHQVQAALAERTAEADWRLFCRHHIDHVPYGPLSIETGRTVQELNGAIRAVTGILRKSMRLELLKEGLTEDEVDEELHRMLEVLRP